MNTYKWEITALGTLPSPPAPVNEFLFFANYTVTATDGINSVDFQSQAQFKIDHKIDNSTYTPYSDLKQEQVISWIQAIENLKENVEANLDNQLYEINNPPIVPELTPLPWASK
jgi:hypothetical protein